LPPDPPQTGEAVDHRASVTGDADHHLVGVAREAEIAAALTARGGREGLGLHSGRMPSITIPLRIDNPTRYWSRGQSDRCQPCSAAYLPNTLIRVSLPSSGEFQLC